MTRHVVSDPVYRRMWWAMSTRGLVVGYNDFPAEMYPRQGEGLRPTPERVAIWKRLFAEAAQ